MTYGNALKTTPTAAGRALACFRSISCFRRRSRIKLGHALSLPRTMSCTLTLLTSVRNAAISYGSLSGAKGQSCQFGSFPRSEWAFAPCLNTPRILPPFFFTGGSSDSLSRRALTRWQVGGPICLSASNAAATTDCFDAFSFPFHCQVVTRRVVPSYKHDSSKGQRGHRAHRLSCK